MLYNHFELYWKDNLQFAFFLLTFQDNEKRYWTWTRISNWYGICNKKVSVMNKIYVTLSRVVVFCLFCSYIFVEEVRFKLTFMLRWWNTRLSRNLSELLYLSLGRSSHKISPSSWKNDATLTEKHDKWSTQSLPQSLTFFTEAETKGVMFKWRNLWTAKLAKAKPFPECRFKLFVPSRYISLNAGNKEFIKMQNKIISNIADPNKAIFWFQRL